MQARERTVDGRAVRVHEGGEGSPVLLLHGSWGGAAAHWAPVWHELARGHRVIAPELPGVVAGDGFCTLAGYAGFLARLCDALGCGPVFCVGSSLGAAIGRSFAARQPARVRGLVLVDGGPAIAEDRLSRVLLRLPGGRALLRRMMRANSYSPATLRRAFADPSRAPADVVRTLTGANAAQLGRMLALYTAGDPGAAPVRVPVRVIWGREDRLIGFDARAGRAFARALGAEFVVIDAAGHLPQVEQPAAFVAAVEEFMRVA